MRKRTLTDEQRAERLKALNALGSQRRKAARPERRFIGTDGESCDACIACHTPVKRGGACPKCGGTETRHRYRVLAAANANGDSWCIRAPNYLTTEQCLHFLVCTVPHTGTLVGFSLGFDWTKILQQLPNAVLQELLHPRQSEDGHPLSVNWSHWDLRWLGSGLTITEKRSGTRRTIWDVFKYFQCSFVKALDKWKVCPPEEIAAINEMKQERSAFHAADWSPGGDVERYCIQECMLLARMMDRVQEATHQAGLKFWPLHGAGSLAGAMLRKHKVGTHMAPLGDNLDAEQAAKLDMAVRSAYFGGRFEVSRIGPVPGPLHAYDINSAYPYACLSHPSLVGTWERGPSSKRTVLSLDESRYLVVGVEWHTDNVNQAWGPFPVRLDSGAVIYPGNGCGYYWLSEVLAAVRLFGAKHFSIRDTWELKPEDTTVRPFDFLRDYYRQRKEWGKDGPGIVMKLGMNAVYGKLAQTLGYKPPFHSLVWAGMTTAKARAMLMDAMKEASQLDNIISLATDSVVSTTPLSFPGTELLGDWDHKIYEGGLFIVRPGIYFALDEEERLKGWEATTRGRGISRKTLHQYTSRVLEAWERGDETVPMPTERFVGLRTGLTRTDNVMGEWEEYVFNLSFDPRPKRLWAPGDDRSRIRVITEGFWASMPYRAGVDSEESQAMRELKKIIIDQPTGELPIQDVLKVAL